MTSRLVEKGKPPSVVDCDRCAEQEATDFLRRLIRSSGQQHTFRSVATLEAVFLLRHEQTPLSLFSFFSLLLSSFEGFSRLLRYCMSLCIAQLSSVRAMQTRMYRRSTTMEQQAQTVQWMGPFRGCSNSIMVRHPGIPQPSSAPATQSQADGIPAGDRCPIACAAVGAKHTTRPSPCLWRPRAAGCCSIFAFVAAAGDVKGFARYEQCTHSLISARTGLRPHLALQQTCVTALARGKLLATKRANLPNFLGSVDPYPFIAPPVYGVALGSTTCIICNFHVSRRLSP